MDRADEVLAKILSILPDAEIGEDNEGQILVYTGIYQDGAIAPE